MTADDSFYEQLKANPAALDAAQTVLQSGFSSVTSSSTTAEKATALGETLGDAAPAELKAAAEAVTKAKASCDAVPK